MVGKDKIRVSISMSKTHFDLISKFADAIKMTKSEFIEDVCVTFIGDVVKHQQEMNKKRKEAKKGQA